MIAAHRRRLPRVALAAWMLCATVAATAATAQPPAAAPAPALTLDDLEQRALAHNPATAAAEAAIRAADARRAQAGLWPNPIVGYSGEDLPLHGDRQGGKNGFFVAQDIPLGKLGADQRVLAGDLAAARVDAGGARLRLQAEVRRLFYRTLAAQQRLAVRNHLAALAREAVEVSGQLFNTGAADAPDRLASENEASLLEAARDAARIDLEELWTALAAVIADPALPARATLAGDLAAGPPALDRDAWRRRLFADSPVLRLAGERIARAEAALARARAARLPDLTLQGGIRHDRTPVAPGGPEIGEEAFADIGLRLPLWNRNQGGIAAAEADLAKARLDAESIRIGLDSRFADRYGRYRQAVARADAYRHGILERARTAYDLYLRQYRQMTAAYPQVLMAERTLFQLEDDYLTTLDRAWEACVAIQTLQLGGGAGSDGGAAPGMDMGGSGSAMGLATGMGMATPPATPEPGIDLLP